MGEDNGERPAADRIAYMLPISTATSIANASKIIESRHLYSKKRLIELGLSKKKEEKTPEEILGTDRAVFFFCAPFAYPETDFGFLFKPEIENVFSDHTTASPFDSGGLLEKITINSSDKAPVSFLKNHLLPPVDHRKLLCESLVYLFATPSDYIYGDDPVKKGPVPLSGGDRRRWTHEVRIEKDISIAKYLEAVFVPINRTIEKNLEDFLTECKYNKKIPVKKFVAPTHGKFEALKMECIDYLEDMLNI